MMKLWRLVPQKRRAFEEWKGEVRGASCPWGSVLPPAWIPWVEVWQLGTPLPQGFSTQYHSLASLSSFYSSLGRMRLYPSPSEERPTTLPPRQM